MAATAVGLVAVFAVLGSSPTAAAVQPRPHARTVQESRIAAAVVRLLDAERATAGLPRLHPRPALQLSARRHDVAMAEADTMAHRLPGEPAFTARIRAAGYRWRWAGENIAWNAAMTRRGALQLERIMFAERPPNDEHRVNILDPHFRDVGVDVYLDSRHHRLWLTTDFATH